MKTTPRHHQTRPRIDAEALMNDVVSPQNVRSGRRIYLSTPFGPREATREESQALRALAASRGNAGAGAVLVGIGMVLAPALLALAL